MDKLELRKQIEKYFDQEVPINKMAELLDNTEHTVKINLPPEKLKIKILRLVEQGLSYSQIGEEIGLAHNTIASYAKDSDQEKAIIEEIQLRFKNGESLNTIANDFSMGKQNVLRYIPDSIRFIRLEDLYLNQGLQFDEICENIGIGRTSLKNWLYKSGFIHRHKNGGKFANFPKKILYEIILN